LAKDTSPTLQSVILTLQEFWADQGCVIWQPYHTEVGAGTMNPATFLRVLGPEPWWVAYVEPSIRPADGRYGENPNRWQHYYQFQVILKPDPGDPIERFLDSLVALGIDPSKHDIRFVEDNWVAPALGAWGLGWEVWLDGQEITQYTYFQQAGGQTLDPVSVEITYGLERIVLALQDVESFVDIRWNENVTYGDLNLKGEQEYSRYNFKTADVERLRTIFDEFEAEARACLKTDLVLPAHDYVLKCSHIFNLLDSRGAVGVTERATLFTRMRDISRQVAESYVDQRRELGFPLKDRWATISSEPVAVEKLTPPDKPADFLLEIGTEELPAGDLDSALAQLRQSVSALLSENRLEHGEIKIHGTPRRLVVYVENLAPAQTEVSELTKGPPAERAFDDEGNPTKAALGFASSKGVPVEALEVRELDGGQYVVVEVAQPGMQAHTVLLDDLPQLITGLKFENSMRWNQTGVAFSRPIRWLLALHGETVIPFEYAGLQAERLSRSLRFDSPAEFSVDNPRAYLDTLNNRGIMLDSTLRRQEIEKQISTLAKEVKGVVEEDPVLLAEVTNLVEQPTALRGQFDESFLELPEQVLISVMKRHQRYFPVHRDGELLPYFIAVCNGGPGHIEGVARGNEQVLRARFADAAYFIQRDLEHPLESYLSQLATLTFQTELGSMLEKSQRIERLTEILAGELGLTAKEKQVALRAAKLSKADLVTQMVVEMTSLQGEMGREYAIQSGEKEEVAQAIFEHHLPRFAGDLTPDSRPGMVVGIADRLDTLMGLFATGQQPTGARDPFGLRRAAIGLVQIVLDNEVKFNIRQALDWAASGLPRKVTEEAVQACFEFIVARQQAYLLGEGHRHDAVEAALAEQGHDPLGAANAVATIEQWRTFDNWDEILQAYARCARITRDESEIFLVDPKDFVEDDERALFKVLEVAEKAKGADGSTGAFMDYFTPLIPKITTFFDEVLVMDEADRLRMNRLGLLQRIVALADGVADFSKLEGF
jgi:glycyl-tRNA synthetase